MLKVIAYIIQWQIIVGSSQLVPKIYLTFVNCKFSTFLKWLVRGLCSAYSSKDSLPYRDLTDTETERRRITVRVSWLMGDVMRVEHRSPANEVELKQQALGSS